MIFGGFAEVKKGYSSANPFFKNFWLKAVPRVSSRSPKYDIKGKFSHLPSVRMKRGSNCDFCPQQKLKVFILLSEKLHVLPLPSKGTGRGGQKSQDCGGDNAMQPKLQGFFCFFLKCVSDMQCLEERERPWLHSHGCQSWLFWSTSDTPAEEEHTMCTDSLSFTTLLCVPFLC